MKCLYFTSILCIPLLAASAFAGAWGTKKSFSSSFSTARRTNGYASHKTAVKFSPTFTKQAVKWQAGPLGTTALTKKTSGQESFQSSPLVVKQALPITTHTTTGSVSSVRPVTNLLTNVGAIQGNANSGVKSPGTTGGHTSFQTLPLVIHQAFPIRTPGTVQVTAGPKVIGTPKGPSFPGVKILSSGSLQVPKTNVLISRPRPLPLVAVQQVNPVQTAALTALSIPQQGTPRKGKASEDYPLRAKLAMDKINEEQSKELSQLLGSLEMLLLAGANATGMDPKTLQDAMDAAKNGDFTALQNLINDPTTNPQMKDALDAFLKTAELLQDGKQGGPLDDQKLQALEDALKKFPASPFADSLLNTLDSVQKWNVMANELDNLPQGPGGDAAQILGTVQEALAIAGYGDVFGGAPNYGYADGYYTAPAVPAAPTYPVPPVPAAPAATATIIVANPTENGVAMPFLLNSQTTEVPAGQYIELPADQAWEIKFDRGEGFGAAAYRLIAGSYKFIHSGQGWDLVQGE